MTNKRDLKAYVRYDGNGRIIAGGNILARNKPKVGTWTEIAAYECCNGCISSWSNAVAPDNVVITVDAVGANPVTWYLRIFYCDYNGIYLYRSLPSEEVEFIVGDDTVLITISYGTIPSWANEVDWYIGTASGTYPNGSYSSQASSTIALNDEYDISYPDLLNIPIYQIDANNCTPNDDSCIHQGFFMGGINLSGSYLLNENEVNFKDTEEEACAALIVVNSIPIDILVMFAVDLYINEDSMIIYYENTCTSLETGYYIFDMGGEYSILHVVDGLYHGIHECITTTTTSTTTAAPTTTTTTTTVAPTTTTTTTETPTTTTTTTGG